MFEKMIERANTEKEYEDLIHRGNWGFFGAIL